jgi:hypothetical protein
LINDDVIEKIEEVYTIKMQSYTLLGRLVKRRLNAKFSMKISLRI